MRRYEDERSEDEIEAAYEDESDRDDRLYHVTKENLLAPRSEWGPNEWRLAQIEGRLQPQRGEPCTSTRATRKSPAD